METLSALDTALHRAAPAALYVLIGDHDGMRQLGVAVVQRAVRTRADEAGAALDVVRYDAATVVPSRLRDDWNAGQLFAAHRLVIVQQAHSWKAPAWQDLADAVSAGLPPYTVVLLCLDKADQRFGGVKTLLQRGTAVECRAPFARAVPAWVKLWGDVHGLALGQDVVHSLIERCGADLTALEQALQKLTIHAAGRQLRVIAPELLDQVLPQLGAGNIFALTDAVGAQQTATAMRMLNELVDAGEAPVWIVAMLARHWRMLTKVGDALRTQPRLDAQRVVSLIRVAPMMAPKYLEQARRLSVRTLRRGFTALAHADRALKSSRNTGINTLTTCVMRLLGNQ